MDLIATKEWGLEFYPQLMSFVMDLIATSRFEGNLELMRFYGKPGNPCRFEGDLETHATVKESREPMQV